MTVSAKEVMALRKKTGLGMMDCKKALGETNGDQAAAEEMLRAQLKGKMDTRTERAAAEGRLAVKVTGDCSAVAMIEVNTETDFTARNDYVAEQSAKMVDLVLDGPAGEVTASDGITAIIDEMRIKTGENASYRRGVKLEGACCGCYLHHDNQKGVVISFTGAVDDDVIAGICMHATAHVPIAVGVDADDVPAEAIEKVRSEAREDALSQGKPAEIAEKIVEGRVRKFLAENTLLGQKYVKDPEGKQTIGDLLPEGVKILKFVRYAVGV